MVEVKDEMCIVDCDDVSGSAAGLMCDCAYLGCIITRQTSQHFDSEVKIERNGYDRCTQHRRHGTRSGEIADSQQFPSPDKLDRSKVRKHVPKENTL